MLLSSVQPLLSLPLACRGVVVLSAKFASSVVVGLAILCAVLLPLDAAFAQSTTVPVAPEPSAAHLAAARQLVVVSGMSRSFAAAVPQTMEHLGSTFTQTRPELTQDLTAVLAQLKPDFDKRADQMIDVAAHIFARLMSEADIKAANAFFESAAGKKYVETQPAFFNDVVNAMQDWQQKLAQDMVTRAREEMKKKGHDM
jgi:uncharacterized protein